jgi:hypothetical protein
MDVTAARPGWRRGPAFRQLVQLLATHEAAEQAHVHPKINGELANRLAMPVLGPADRCRDLIRR